MFSVFGVVSKRCQFAGIIRLTISCFWTDISYMELKVNKKYLTTKVLAGLWYDWNKSVVTVWQQSDGNKVITPVQWISNNSFDSVTFIASHRILSNCLNNKYWVIYHIISLHYNKVKVWFQGINCSCLLYCSLVYSESLLTTCILSMLKIIPIETE